MAKMNILQIGVYSLTGKLIGKLPIQGTANVARKAAEEGIVLLKNNGTLPLKKGKVALFGCGSKDTAVCGTGSGYAFSPYTLSVYDGLIENGYEVTTSLWLKNYDTRKKAVEKKDKSLTFLDKRFSGVTPYFDVNVITDEELQEAKGCDAAFYVIKRNTGEGFDRKAEKGDYYLSDNEKANIELLGNHFKEVIVILNTCVIDAKWLEESESVSAIVLLGQAGLEAGRALGNIIRGKVSPSGRLTDTFALSYEDYPASKTFSNNDGDTFQEDYVEDIYVGYRHFDTKKLDVVYPFGYGLSYTTFVYENYQVRADWDAIHISLEVKNTGEVASKDVVQVYVSAPEGKLNKPYQELKGYHKTKLLKPNEVEEVEIKIPTRDLSSYDEESSSWIMEKGKYLLRVGKDSRNTTIIGAIELDATVKVVQLSKQLTIDRELNYDVYPTYSTDDYNEKIYPLRANDYTTIDESSKISKTLNCYTTDNYQTKESTYHFKWDTEEEPKKVRSVNKATLLDVLDNKITIEEFVATLDDEILVRLLTGSSQETKYPIPSRLPKGTFKSNFNGSASGKTTDLFSGSLGVPACSLADGPAGLHLMGTPTTAFPVGMVLAQTFNNDIIYDVGDAYGKEMEYFDIALCLGPGMNIHRDPLCGRNFEYYSEDPFVSGYSAASFINGLQEKHPGFGVAAKHFCCNNQELDRAKSNSSVSERALREIYLKGFEIAVKLSQPETIMSSYNLLNGIHTSSRYDLLTDVLRGEWGFAGFVMTDWDGDSDRIMDLQAGNDILMGGYSSDELMAAVDNRKPVFNEDGSIKQNKIKMYGGVMSKMVDCWNSFQLDAEGKDTITVSYKDTIPESVKKFVQEGFATIHEDTKEITYKGNNRSNSLKRSVLQRNAIRILRYYVNGAPMKLATRK